MLDLSYLVLIAALFALRRKIEADPARPRWLLTEAGVGYRMREPAPDGSAA